MDSSRIHDLVVIGGGINGCGIARDAAGRVCDVLLAEQDDLAGGTSSAATKLIHDGLRHLECYKFRLVREALAGREVLWTAAPRIVRPYPWVDRVLEGALGNNGASNVRLAKGSNIVVRLLKSLMPRPAAAAGWGREC